MLVSAIQQSESASCMNAQVIRNFQGGTGPPREYKEQGLELPFQTFVFYWIFKKFNYIYIYFNVFM